MKFQKFSQYALCGVAIMACLYAAVYWDLFEKASETSHTEKPSKVLNEKDRQFLWDAEHNGLVLGRSGLSVLADALKQSDRATFQRALVADFSGEIPSQVREVRLERDYLQVVRAYDTGTPAKKLNRDEFVEWLFRFRELFSTAPNRVSFQLTAIHPVSRENLDGDWAGRCRLILAGESEPGKPQFVQLHCRFLLKSPTKKTLEQGAWLRNWRVERIDQSRADHFLMREVAAERGIDLKWFHDNWKSSVRQVNTGGAYLCDYNRDGFVDLLVTDSESGTGIKLYQGTAGGRFVDVTVDVGLPAVPMTIDAIFADLDNDGWVDLILPGQFVFRNEQGQRFSDITSQTNLSTLIQNRSPQGALDSLSGVSVADYDLDGLVDLYVTRGDATSYKSGSWIDGKSGETIGNQLLKNLGNWQFEDVTDSTGTSGDGSSAFTSVWLDANNDHLPDLYVINEYGAGVLLVNQKNGRFKSHRLTEHSADFGSMGLTCGDIDNDGNIDLFVSNMYSKAGNRVIDNLPAGFYSDTVMFKLRRMVAGNQLYHNTGGLRFEPVAETFEMANVGWGWGPAMADLDNDGFLDVYATCGFMSKRRDQPDG